MINVVCLDKADLFYDIRALNPNVKLVDLFDEISPCSAKIVPSLPPYSGIGGSHPTENEILYMTLNGMSFQKPHIYVNYEGRMPIIGKEHHTSYMFDQRTEFIERNVTPYAREMFEMLPYDKYPIPKQGYGIKLSTLLKLEPEAKPLVITVDKKYQSFVHAYVVGNRYYFLYNVMGISHRPDSKLYKQYGFPIGDILFNMLLEKYNALSPVQSYYIQ